MDLDIRYVAGLFDGEGWVTLGKTNLAKRYHYSDGYVRYQLHVGIAMVHKPLIERLHQTFGGHIAYTARQERQSDKTRGSFKWGLASLPAAEFLAKIEPHLICKREEALIGIEFQKHVRAHTNDFRYRPEMRDGLYAERDDFITRLRAYKAREYSPVGSDPIPVRAAG